MTSLSVSTQKKKLNGASLSMMAITFFGAAGIGAVAYDHLSGNFTRRVNEAIAIDVAQFDQGKGTVNCGEAGLKRKSEPELNRESANILREGSVQDMNGGLLSAGQVRDLLKSGRCWISPGMD
jgi:hypothetical protein